MQRINKSSIICLIAITMIAGIGTPRFVSAEGNTMEVPNHALHVFSALYRAALQQGLDPVQLAADFIIVGNTNSAVTVDVMFPATTSTLQIVAQRISTAETLVADFSGAIPDNGGLLVPVSGSSVGRTDMDPFDGLMIRRFHTDLDIGGIASEVRVGRTRRLFERLMGREELKHFFGGVHDRVGSTLREIVSEEDIWSIKRDEFILSHRSLQAAADNNLNAIRTEFLANGFLNQTTGQIDGFGRISAHKPTLLEGD